MLDWVGYHTRLLLTADLPWYVYLVVAIVGAIAVLSFVTGRVGQMLAVLCVVAGWTMAAYVMGSARMHEADQAAYQRQADAEQQRLKAAVAEAQSSDKQHQAEAEAYIAQLQQERNDAVSHLADNPTGNRGPTDATPTQPTAVLGGRPTCGINADAAARLYAIGGKAHARSTGGTSSNPLSAAGIRRLFHPRHKVPTS